MYICDKKECCGCYACVDICPKNAIIMEEDENGFIYPTIDEKKCIKCSKCKNVCEIRKSLKKNETKECYSSYSLDESVHKSSSSGGVAYELYKYTIDNGGVIYGVSSFTDNEGDIAFIRTDSIEEIKKMQGSKYVHAYIKDIYSNLLKDLKDNKYVLFIGTPCQVAGLKAFLNKDYINLITVDLVCHGVMPQKTLKSQINKEYDYINFRGESGFKFVAQEKKRIVYNKNKYQSDYFYAFLNGLGYRENCYSCVYAQKKRIGDITIGDFWAKKNYQEMNGISLVLINTQKGKEFFEKIDSLFKEKDVIENAYINNEQLIKPTKKNDDYQTFLNNIKRHNIKFALKKHLGKEYYIVKIKGILKNIKDKIK